MPNKVSYFGDFAFFLIVILYVAISYSPCKVVALPLSIRGRAGVKLASSKLCWQVIFVLN